MVLAEPIDVAYFSLPQEQFAFIHDAVLESVTCGDTQISTSDLRSAIRLMQKRNCDINKTPFEVQFEVTCGTLMSTLLIIICCSILACNVGCYVQVL